MDVVCPWGRSRLLPLWDKDALKVPREFPGPIPSMDGHCETDVGVIAGGRDVEAVGGGILGQGTVSLFCRDTESSSNWGCREVAPVSAACPARSKAAWGTGDGASLT